MGNSTEQRIKHLYKTNIVLVFPPNIELHFSGYAGQIWGVGIEHIYYSFRVALLCSMPEWTISSCNTVLGCSVSMYSTTEGYKCDRCTFNTAGSNRVVPSMSEMDLFVRRPIKYKPNEKY